MDTTLAPQPTSNVVFVSDMTSAQGASETPSSPLDVTMLAMLGLTMAGAGVMKSQSAQKKQQELAQANALAQAQLATAKADQAQTAGANWEQNQAMQANATQKVYTQVQQSQANIDFWASYTAWKIKVAEAEEKRRQAELEARIKAYYAALRLRPVSSQPLQSMPVLGLLKGLLTGAKILGQGMKTVKSIVKAITEKNGATGGVGISNASGGSGFSGGIGAIGGGFGTSQEDESCDFDELGPDMSTWSSDCITEFNEGMEKVGLYLGLAEGFRQYREQQERQSQQPLQPSIDINALKAQLALDYLYGWGINPYRYGNPERNTTRYFTIGGRIEGTIAWFPGIDANIEFHCTTDIHFPTFIPIPKCGYFLNLSAEYQPAISVNASFGLALGYMGWPNPGDIAWTHTLGAITPLPGPALEFDATLSQTGDFIFYVSGGGAKLGIGLPTYTALGGSIYLGHDILNVPAHVRESIDLVADVIANQHYEYNIGDE